VLQGAESELRNFKQHFDGPPLKRGTEVTLALSDDESVCTRINAKEVCFS
jgi:hypothetical protein